LKRARVASKNLGKREEGNPLLIFKQKGRKKKKKKNHPLDDGETGNEDTHPESGTEDK